MINRAEESVDPAVQANINALLDTLRQSGIVVEGAELVCSYLHAYPDLMDTVRAMSLAVRREFPDACLTLTLYQDPEVEDEFLSLFVRREAYDGSETARIRRIHEQFRENTQGVSGWFLVLTDFQPPKKNEF